MNIDRNIKAFLKEREPEKRYSSFDYCFNYFQSFKEKNKVHELSSSKNMQTSCLHLAFYLASWGMLRGSSYLLGKSTKFYSKLIKYIAGLGDSSLWDIDVNCYSEANVESLLHCKKRIAEILGLNKKGIGASDTLLTKIMLGVFGNIPAFDSYFTSAFPFSRCSKKSLREISGFYKKHGKEINGFKVHTLDFNTGKKTKRLYTKAKLIDMAGFIEGQKGG